MKNYIFLIIILGIVMNNTIASPLYFRAEIKDKTIMQMVERWHRETKFITYWDGVSDEKIQNIESFNKENNLEQSNTIEYSLTQVVSYYNKKTNDKYQICWYHTKEALAVIKPKNEKCD